MNISTPNILGLASSRPTESPEVLAISKPRYFHLNGFICGRELTFLIDTGSELECLDKKVYDALPNAPELIEPDFPVAFNVNGDPLRCYGMIKVTMQIPHEGTTYDLEMILYVVKSSSREGILGQQFLMDHGGIINAKTGTLTIEVQGRTITTQSLLPQPERMRIPNIAGLSHHKEERRLRQDRDDSPKRKPSIRLGKKRKRIVSQPRIEATTQTDPEYEKDRSERLEQLVGEGLGSLKSC